MECVAIRNTGRKLLRY